MLQGQALFAERAGGGLIGLRCHLNETEARARKIRGPAAPVHDNGDRQAAAAPRRNDIDRLRYASAARNHVFSHKKPLARRDSEPAPQDQGAVLFLGKNRAHAQRSRELVANHDPAHRRRDHRIHLRVR